MAGLGALDTPRTNVGDATYLSRQPELEISEEEPFQSPSKDANIFQQLGKGGRPNLRTPRGRRGPFSDRRNLPAGAGAPEFTPLLKSATKRSARRHIGKENLEATPAFLDKIDEDMTPLPNLDNSVFSSRNTSSFLGRTPVAQLDSDSTVSTPMPKKSHRNPAKSPLQDNEQLSLREQENVIDRIGKENFGLKLRVHFLEDALRKAAPGSNEAAVKENTELKVNRVIMQRELHRCKKQLTTAERDLETHRQKILDVQEKSKKKNASEEQRLEIDRLQQALHDKEAGMEELQRQLELEEKERGIIERLQDEISDLETDNREKDRIITQHQDELEDLKLRVQAAEDKARESTRRMIDLEGKAEASTKLEEAKENIQDLEADIRRLEGQLEEFKDKFQDAVDAKERAEGDLEELQEEMANKSVVTKGLSRQVEEKMARLQDEVGDARTTLAEVSKRYQDKEHEAQDLKRKLKETRQEHESFDRERRSLKSQVEDLETDLRSVRDQKSLLQTRNDSLAAESASLQRDLGKLQKSLAAVEADLEQEKQHALQIERNTRERSNGEVSRLRAEIAELQTMAQESEEDHQHTIQANQLAQDQLRDEVERLKDQISDLQAEIREKDNLYDNDSEKWETEKRKLEAERDRADERASGLQRTIEKLRETEGTLSNKETRLQQIIDSETQRHKSEEAVLSRQIDELQESLESRQAMLEDLRAELSTVRDELQRVQLDHQTAIEKVESLEDEIDVLQDNADAEAEKANQELDRAKLEREDLMQQLKSLQDAVARAERKSTSVSQEVAKHNAEHIERLKVQLTESTAKFARSTKEKQQLQEQLMSVNVEVHSLRASLTETKAECDMLDGELMIAKRHGADAAKLDHERIELRTAKAKLDNEVRRLREENKSLSAHLSQVEKELQNANQADQDTYRLDQERMDLLAAKTRLDGDVRRMSEENKSLASRLREVETELRLVKQQGQQTTQLEQQRGDVAAAKTKLESELRRLKEENAVMAAERAEIEEDLLLLSKHRGEDTFELDNERINLRVTKTKLESEMRRLKDENKQLAEHRLEIESRLDDELEKAAAEEERLTHEIIALQTKLRQSTDTQALTAARRTIRELERRIDDYEAQLAIHANMPNIEGNSDLSILRRDITNARQKERDYAEREAAHKSIVRDLKRQIADLERNMHEEDMNRLRASPVNASTPPARKSELTQLRHQLSLAHQVGQDLKKALRDAERDADAMRDELQARIGDLEDQAASLEQQLDDARSAADEAAVATQTAVSKYKGKLERYRRERDEYAASLEEMHQNRLHLTTQSTSGSTLSDSNISLDERRDLHGMLRKAQIAADTYERQSRDHKTTVDDLSKAYETVRLKLERVRGERAVYRADVEKARRELRAAELSNAELTRAKEEAEGAIVANALLLATRGSAAVEPPKDKDPDTSAEQINAVVDKAQRQRERHQRELRGLVTQIEWMQARWERESQFRIDAVNSKLYLQGKLEEAEACNKIDHNILEGIIKTIGQRQIPMPEGRQTTAPANLTPRGRLRQMLLAVRFVVRTQRAAAAWSVQLETRQRLREALDKVQQASRARRQHDEWREAQRARLDAGGLATVEVDDGAGNTTMTIISVEY